MSFIFGDQKHDGTTWFNDAAEPLTVTLSTNHSGSIDTSAIDAYRQGVEMSSIQHWTNGLVKIHAGETDHVLRQLSFGAGPNVDTTTTRYNNARWFNESDRYDAYAAIRSNHSGSFSTYLNDDEQDYNRPLNGIIEPLAIRTSSDVKSQQYVNAHVVRATFGSGNADSEGRTDVVEHVHRTNAIDKIAAYVDNSTIASSSLDRPYDDTLDSRSRILQDVFERNPDMRAALSQLDFSTDSYVPSGSLSPTSGFSFESVTGTDSIAFGEMTYLYQPSIQIVNVTPTPTPSFDPSDWYDTLIEADWDATGVILTSGKVSTWTDQTGRHDATQTNASYRPTVETGVDFGGLQVIRGPGVGTGVTLSTSITGLSTVHVFWIGRIISTPAHSIWGFGTSANVPYYYLSASSYENAFTDTRMTTAVGARDQTIAHCYEVVSKAGSYATKFNGASWGSRASNNVAFKATQCLLCDAIGSANTITQLVARIIVCNAEITDANRTELVTYLNAKYGLSMS